MDGDFLFFDLLILSLSRKFRYISPLGYLSHIMEAPILFLGRYFVFLFAWRRCILLYIVTGSVPSDRGLPPLSPVTLPVTTSVRIGTRCQIVIYSVLVREYPVLNKGHRDYIPIDLFERYFFHFILEVAKYERYILIAWHFLRKRTLK